MHKGRLEEHLAHRPGPYSAAAHACVLLACLATPLQADESPERERSAGGHRWLAPMWISAPATSVLAVAGIAGLAAHLFRRRRQDKPRPTSQRPDEDWDRRIAMWEERLRGDQPAATGDGGGRAKADDKPPER
jgi:hypothetical protein